MGKRGPKPRPDRLKLAGGSRASALPECPSHLDPIAAKEWGRMVEVLAEAGLLTRTDGSVLALYCSAFSRWIRACEKIREQEDNTGNGLTEITGQGSLKVSPHVQIAAAAEAQMMRLLAEFGATPSSRARVSAPAEAPEDEFTKFLRSRKA